MDFQHARAELVREIVRRTLGEGPLFTSQIIDRCRRGVTSESPAQAIHLLVYPALRVLERRGEIVRVPTGHEGPRVPVCWKLVDPEVVDLDAEWQKIMGEGPR